MRKTTLPILISSPSRTARCGNVAPAFAPKTISAPVRLGEFAMAADEIRVQVRLDHILDLEILRRGFFDVLIDVALRITTAASPSEPIR